MSTTEPKTKYREPWFLSNENDAEEWVITDGVESFPIAAASQAEFGLAVGGTIERAASSPSAPTEDDREALIEDVSLRLSLLTPGMPPGVAAEVERIRNDLAARRSPVAPSEYESVITSILALCDNENVSIRYDDEEPTDFVPTRMVRELAERAPDEAAQELWHEAQRQALASLAPSEDVAHLLDEAEPIREQMRELLDEGWCICRSSTLPASVLATYERMVAALRSGSAVPVEATVEEWGWNTGSTYVTIGGREQAEQIAADMGAELGVGDWGSRFGTRTPAGPWQPFVRPDREEGTK